MVKGDGEYCTYCRRELVAYTATHPTRDHVMPKSKGGRATVWCCSKCNSAKGDMLPEEWDWFMKTFPDWWKVPGREARARKAVTEQRRRRAFPTTVPREFSDPKAQAAFEAVYKNRLHLLTDTAVT